MSEWWVREINEAIKFRNIGIDRPEYRQMLKENWFQIPKESRELIRQKIDVDKLKEN